MNEIFREIDPLDGPGIARGKFENPNWTASGEKRASVALKKIETLWINTGTLCNIECANCYIKSSPKNDDLVYITAPEVVTFLDEIKAGQLGTREIGFTGGEPFLNPHMLGMMGEALRRGFEVLVLTNAMQPMQRRHIREGLMALNQSYRAQLTLRVSLDHYSETLHDKEREEGSFQKTVEGLDWLSQHNFTIAIAGRTCWEEAEELARAGYEALIQEHGWAIDSSNASQLVLFPEMDESGDIPEITVSCWDILNVRPEQMMCATSRMVVKRKGARAPTLLPCTLIAYDQAFDMGATLAEAAEIDGGMFDQGMVKLCHPYCAKFCVLGGGSCSAHDEAK